MKTRLKKHWKNIPAEHKYAIFMQMVLLMTLGSMVILAVLIA
jgi:hypothetical protein